MWQGRWSPAIQWMYARLLFRDHPNSSINCTATQASRRRTLLRQTMLTLLKYHSPQTSSSNISFEWEEDPSRYYSPLCLWLCWHCSNYSPSEQHDSTKFIIIYREPEQQCRFSPSLRSWLSLDNCLVTAVNKTASLPSSAKYAYTHTSVFAIHIYWDFNHHRGNTLNYISERPADRLKLQQLRQLCL